MPDSCFSKEVSYSLSANLQVIVSQEARKRTQNVLQPFAAEKKNKKIKEICYRITVSFFFVFRF